LAAYGALHQMNRPPKSKEHHEIARSLAAMKLINDGEPFTSIALGGGVSCDVWLVTLQSGSQLVLKRALPKLRVAADWRASAGRSVAEVRWMKLVATQLNRNLVPKILGEDAPQHTFAMEYLPPDEYPLWKSQLSAGMADSNFAAQVGSALARIHAATASRPDIASQFSNDAQFSALRLEPYLLHTAKKHPDLAPRFRALADEIAAARIALMQGDISPKNILRGPEGPIFLDAETACYGDPAFDLAFCLNHLLLKCVWHPEFTSRYLACLATLAAAYWNGVCWEPPAAIEARTAALLPALLLARIDGKSPVEYLTRESDMQFVRGAARTLFAAHRTSLGAIAEDWRRFLATR
jgi:5-methylthioribose kinase